VYDYDFQVIKFIGKFIGRPSRAIFPAPLHLLMFWLLLPSPGDTQQNWQQYAQYRISNWQEFAMATYDNLNFIAWKNFRSVLVSQLSHLANSNYVLVYPNLAFFFFLLCQPRVVSFCF
jgi:hypothetical protein